MSLSEDAGRLLQGLKTSSWSDCWVTPAESRADAWVLVKPLGMGSGFIAARKVPETAITELVRSGDATWTAADEDVPPYLCGALSREQWFRGRKGRRIAVLGGGCGVNGQS